MRIRVGHGMDAAESKRKAKKRKTGKAKQVFTEVGELSGEETHTNSDEDEAIQMTSDEEENAHASDDEEKVGAKK